MQPDVQGIQRRMKDTRTARNMSLEAVAKAAGMSKSHIWEMERGKASNPTVSAVWAISGALAVSPAWLLGLDPDAPPIDPLALEVAALINRRLLTQAPEQSDTQSDGYKTAWYEIANELGIPAQTISPRQVHEEQVMPALKNLISNQS